ncbi:MAG: type II toxin-antitoxin system RelE/ParE family toxin [Candidatus Tectomicrobia bacterium]|nr:type II toxin-antitoxin system RelE/ParE family toxin [Candidatus Tectomicrobia bacterium]
MAWTIEYAKSVQKFVRKLEPQTRSRIRDYLEKQVAALDDPRTLGKALRGHLGNLWRYRVGDYRIICDVQDDRLVVLVVEIGYRRDVYR